MNVEAEEMSYLQTKCDRQAKALTLLQRRVENQRATLRAINQLGRDLTPEEFDRMIKGSKDHTGQELEPVAV